MGRHKEELILNPSCSEWICRLQDGEEISIETDTFPNDALSTIVYIIKKGIDPDTLHWENSGGGAHPETLTTAISIAKILQKIDSLELPDNLIKAIDKVNQDYNEVDWEVNQDTINLLKNLKIKNIDKVALELFKFNSVFGNLFVSNPNVSKKVREEIKEQLFLKEL